MTFDSKDILFRCREALGEETDKGLITRFGYAHSNGTKWRAKNTIPIELVVKVAIESGVSLDYLVFGKKVRTDKKSFENALGDALTSLVAGGQIIVSETYDRETVKEVANEMRLNLIGEESGSKLDLLSRIRIPRA